MSQINSQHLLLILQIDLQHLNSINIFLIDHFIPRSQMDSMNFQKWSVQPCYGLSYQDTETCSPLSTTVGLPDFSELFRIRLRADSLG